MSSNDLPERVWIERGCEYPHFYEDNSEDCTEYIRADRIPDAEIARLRRVIDHMLILTGMQLESSSLTWNAGNRFGRSVPFELAMELHRRNE